MSETLKNESKGEILNVIKAVIKQIEVTGNDSSTDKIITAIT